MHHPINMRLLLFCCLLPCLLPAQSGFLKDPDIVWAAEIEQDWVVDILSLENEWDEGITTLKLLRTEQNSRYWATPYLSELVFRAIMDGKLPVYKDPQCTMPADPLTVFPGKDTVTTFDPETYEEKVSIVWVEPDPAHDFKAWRLRQVLSYHRKSATWSTRVEAVAPLILVKNPAGDSIGMRPLCWFRPEDKRPKTSSNHIVWAKKTVNRQPATRVPAVPPNPVKLSDGFQNPLIHQLKLLETDMKTPFYDTWNEAPLPPAERKSMLARTDTVVTFDPETYEEKVMVVKNEINPDNIRSLRLVQTWYWDERRQRLSICLDAVAPLLDVTDSFGNFRYQRPLYYRKTKN